MLIYWNDFKRKYLGQKGQGMLEYAVIVALVIAIGAGITSGRFKDNMIAKFNNLVSTADTATGSGTGGSGTGK